MHAWRGVSIVVAGLALTAGCADSRDDPAEPSPAPVASSTSSASSPVEFDQALHDELVAMLERDQAEQSGQPVDETTEDRTARLKQILDEHGWPGFDLVGRDGGDAAWAIAQHADLDPAFQAEALELLREAVAEGQASPGNLAYLEDRVAVAAGEPQTYGTQIRCGPDGPVPATPIDDEDGVEQRREDAGLDPLSDYLDEMAELCAQDAPG